MAIALRFAGESPLPKTAGSPHTLARPTIVSEMAVTSGKILAESGSRHGLSSGSCRSHLGQVFFSCCGQIRSRPTFAAKINFNLDVLFSQVAILVFSCKCFFSTQATTSDEFLRLALKNILKQLFFAHNQKLPPFLLQQRVELMKLLKLLDLKNVSFSWFSKMS